MLHIACEAAAHACMAQAPSALIAFAIDLAYALKETLEHKPGVRRYRLICARARVALFLCACLHLVASQSLVGVNVSARECMLTHCLVRQTTAAVQPFCL